MLNLASVTDKIQVVTDAATPVAVHASFVDYDGTTTTPGRKDTPIAAVATTDVVASPAGIFRRNVKALTVKNTHASASVGVTVRHTDGATPVTLEKVTLLAGEKLSYEEFVGFRHLLASGAVKTVDADAFEVLYDSILTGAL